MKNIFTLLMAALICHYTVGSSPLSFTDTSDFAQLRSNLYIVAPDGSTVLMDGSLTQYYSEYSNNMDGMDARKMSNFSENWGMARNNTVYVIERRHSIEGSDSIFFKMWNMRIITYRIELITSGLEKEGRQGILEDKYLKTSTPIDLNGNTYVDFSVTSDPYSKALDRFRIIFSTRVAPVQPLNFTSVSAFEKNNSVDVDWTTANEKDIKQLNIERSVDGNAFTKLNSVTANNTPFNNYHWVDVLPNEGNNYYRICSIDNHGKTIFSNVMKVYVAKKSQNLTKSLTIYPNPVTANNFNLQMTNQPAGLYEVRLINAFGRVFMKKLIQYPGGSSLEKMQLMSTLPQGIYQLEIKTPAGDKKVISVVF